MTTQEFGIQENEGGKCKNEDGMTIFDYGI